MSRFGTVRFFNDVKGFGFVMPDEGGSDVMVHGSRLCNETRKLITAGSRVKYEATETPKGLRIVTCRLVTSGRFAVIEADGKFAVQDRVTNDARLFDTEDQLRAWQTSQVILSISEAAE